MPERYEYDVFMEDMQDERFINAATRAEKLMNFFFKHRSYFYDICYDNKYKFYYSFSFFYQKHAS